MGGQMGGGMGNMRSQFQNLQKQMMEQQEKIAEMEVSSSVGGGVLKITMSGDQICKKVEIDPEFLKDADAERVNIPANPKHYWRYRMHLNIEDLIGCEGFSNGIAQLITLSGR